MRHGPPTSTSTPSCRRVAAARGFQAAAVVALGVAVLRAGRGEAADAASLTLFRAHHAGGLAAMPIVGHPLAIEPGWSATAPVIAQVQIADGDRWRTPRCERQAGSFRLAMPSVNSFRCVCRRRGDVAGTVSVAFPPRVTRIDVDYAYPAALKLEPEPKPTAATSTPRDGRACTSSPIERRRRQDGARRRQADRPRRREIERVPAR